MADIRSLADGRTALEVVCLSGHWGDICPVLSAKADVKLLFSDGRTALELASVAQSWATVGLLVDAQADSNPDTIFTDGRTALEVASLSLEWDIVRVLVASKVNINTTFSDGCTALHAAVSNGKWDLVPMLVNGDTDLSSKPLNGITALELAVHKKKWDIVNCLAKVTGQAPLEVLILARSWDNAHALVEEGIADIKIPFRDDQTAFELVFHACQWTLVHTLVRLGAEIDRVLLPDGTSLDMWVHLPERPPGIRYLFLNGPPTGIQLGDDLPLLEMFTKAGDWESVLDLVALKFDLNEVFKGGSMPFTMERISLKQAWASTDGSTVLRAAIGAQKWDVVQAVINAEANVNQEFRYLSESETAFQSACANGAPTSILELMLKKGADPNTQGTTCRETCLHMACCSKDRVGDDVVSLLLKYGANPDLPDFNKMTPLHHACAYGHTKRSQILLEAGANINAQNTWKGTTLQCACFCGHADCVKLLLDHGADTSIKDDWVKLHSKMHQKTAIQGFLRSSVRMVPQKDLRMAPDESVTG
ncbi:hypothetical protein NMY22_g19201 [Coprinellus aureogranulatus]|nr:hypothetical protein NMY22_g19201 [Coprinellus aureogranulatus]